jgi:hypothetical protein
MSFASWFQNLRDTIYFIHLHGWSEYQKARERYDKHQDAIANKKARYTKAGEIALHRAIKKAKR